MATKTERIISYLPGTFRAEPRTTATYFVADAFGTELLKAENSLAALMSAHWVDHADRSAELISDLACIASLYGLLPQGAPQPAQAGARQTSCPPITSSEESVEEFREHLKSYVRTFLEGTVTVQGILRVAAEALGLRIEDDYEKLDTWWTRDDDALVTEEASGSDAAQLLFGFTSANAVGTPLRAARLTGKADLSGGVDLSGGAVLRLKVDDAAPVNIDLAALLPQTTHAQLAQVTEAINNQLGQTVATHDGRRLTLSSPTSGLASRLEIGNPAGDASPALLGLSPRLFLGSDATAAEVFGQVDLRDGVDLSAERYLRLLIDDEHLAEIDCAGANPSLTMLDEIVSSINAALGLDAASHDGRFLKLTSPTAGFGSSIVFLPAAAQDARLRLFGAVELFHAGQTPKAARATGKRDLSLGVDLSERSKLRIRVNEGPAVTVECAGETPERTLLSEIVLALTAQFGAGVASHDGRFLSLVSPTAGPTSALVFESLPADEDASDLLFGIESRTFRGAAATRARLTGTRDLSEGVDIGALHTLRVALDGGAPVTLNLRDAQADAFQNIRAVTPDEIVSALNAALGAGVASTDGRHITLASQTTGEASRVSIEPVTRRRRRRFITRAFTKGEAAQAVFGFITREARGGAAMKARVVGDADLSRGVDLREERYLRLKVDEWPTVEVDCAGLRPRATLLEEVVTKINKALEKENAEHGGRVARSSPDGQNLVLVSPTSGAASRIAFETPRTADALDLLLRRAPGTTRGRDATSVKFVGTVDLSGGISLSKADAVRIAIDADPPREIHFTEQDAPTPLTLGEIVVAINLAFGKQVAQHDGKHLVLTSTATGANSFVEFVAPSGTDATERLFGIAPPRSYRGENAAPARVVGSRDLSAGVKLSVTRFIRLSVNGGQPLDVDCAARAVDASQATLAEISSAINERLKMGVATHDTKHLVLTSPTQGFASQITLLPFEGRDARAKLLGSAAEVTTGLDATAAFIEGEADLLSPVNLSERQTLKLSVDGGRPFEVNVAGFAPGTTFLDEVVAHINAAFPGLASATPNDHLRLTSPTRGEQSRLSLLPVRVIELVEYPPTEVSFPSQEEATLSVRHSDRWTLENQGAADADLAVVLDAPHGAVGTELVNRTTGQRVRLMLVLRPGERAELWRDAETGLVRAVVIDEAGGRRDVPQTQILAGPLGTRVSVPFDGEWSLAEGVEGAAATLQLDEPQARAVVLLRAQQFGAAGNRIRVRVTEAALSDAEDTSQVESGERVRLQGRLDGKPGDYWITGGDGQTVARVRAGAGVTFEAQVGRVLSVAGALYHEVGDPAPLVIVERVERLFDVTLTGTPDTEPELYAGVVIDGDADAPESLVSQINRGREMPVRPPSSLVRAEGAEKAQALVLPRGRSSWTFRDCFGPRFDESYFSDEERQTRFAGGGCIDRAVFDLSHFARTPPAPDSAVFVGSINDPPVQLRFRWAQHQPGAFNVNLPADLPERFGARFDQSLFARGNGEPELFAGVVTEPLNDEDHIIKRLNDGSTLVKVTAKPVTRVPIGFEAVTIPFRRPLRLKGGDESREARIYLAEKDVPGFIEIFADTPGAWGNSVTIAARKAGPARFDVSINLLGARFENARRVVFGGDELPTLSEDLLRPGPVGILQAKAAGVRANVSRERTDADDSDNKH
ncbi:MAG TPA: hypothetical protein VGV59_12425 [Pyrinomonadaceae bacterium]|nr:hypothetical protein [Pyrinomonadaceae bacterium]